MFVGRRWAETSVTSSPSSRTTPDVGVSKPAIMRSKVDLPHPDGPRSEKNSPFPIPIEILSTALNRPKDLERFSIDT
ncbi:UNVERIFIED_ORG: hypothetical protein J2W85_001532 [Ensifer adhaerens]|nr:hypothetical protein [Ensifer adhaerens]